MDICLVCELEPKHCSQSVNIFFLLKFCEFFRGSTDRSIACPEMLIHIFFLDQRQQNSVFDNLFHKRIYHRKQVSQKTAWTLHGFAIFRSYCVLFFISDFFLFAKLPHPHGDVVMQQLGHDVLFVVNTWKCKSVVFQEIFNSQFIGIPASGMLFKFYFCCFQ